MSASGVDALSVARVGGEGHFVEGTWFKGKWVSEFLYAQLASEWRTTERGE